jgi:hypothetical protein
MFYLAEDVKTCYSTCRLNVIAYHFLVKVTDDIDAVDASLFSVRAIVHPRLKQPMGLLDHLYFVAEHDDHHLARIWELVKRS